MRLDLVNFISKGPKPRMSNQTYLLAAQSSTPTTPESEDVLLQAPYHVPLLWLGLVQKTDFFFQERKNSDGGTYIFCGALASREVAIARLIERQQNLDAKFAAWGSLAYHVRLFTDWLSSLSAPYLCVDWTEYHMLNGDEHGRVAEAIDEADDPDPERRTMLIEVSTVIPGTRFVTLDDAMAGNVSREDMYTFFRLLGSGRGAVRTPWD